jgi:hypothetical protein
MKNLLLTGIAAVFLLTVLSCHKEEITSRDQFPEWLNEKINELVPGHPLCEMTDISVIRYNGKTYYNIYCGIWSCMYCQLYDGKGNHPNWDDKTWNDFLKNQKVIEKVPACDI